MLSSNGNPYLRPEYLNPPPTTTTDSKKSPLALLAQTCSQIGADPQPAGKTSERKKSVSESRDKSSPQLTVDRVQQPTASSSKREKPNEPSRLTPDRRPKSSSPKTRNPPAAATSQQQPAPTEHQPTVSMSQHHQHSLMMADSYKSLMAAYSPAPYGPFGSYPPPGQLDLGAYASALAKSSMPFITSSAAYSAALASMQQQYGRKPDSACRDPYCTGCPGQQLNNPAIHMVCAAGCGLGVQCEHLKVPVAAPPGSPSSASNVNKPYVCNWIVGDNYCGKRFGSSDDLLQHLRTHTNLSSSAESAAAAAAPSAAAAFAHPSSMMRAYPTPPLSPLSAARYHPYGKSPGQPLVPPQQAAGPPHHPPGFPAALFHPSYPPSALFHPHLAPYYSHLFAAPRGSAPLPP